MPGDIHQYVSVLFGSLVQPIVDVLGILDRHGSRRPNEVQASTVENGYSVSVVALSVFLLESAVARSRHVRGEVGRRSAVDALKTLVSNDLAADAEELFVLRDVIAHNHLWLAEIKWDDSGDMRLVSARLVDGYGDDKFARVVDMTTRTTRRLHLDVFPTRIHRSTAVIVIKKCAEVLHSIETQNRQCIYLEPVHVLTGDEQYLPFYEWVDGLNTSA